MIWFLGIFRFLLKVVRFCGMIVVVFVGSIGMLIFLFEMILSERLLSICLNCVVNIEFLRLCMSWLVFWMIFCIFLGICVLSVEVSVLVMLVDIGLVIFFYIGSVFLIYLLCVIVVGVLVSFEMVVVLFSYRLVRVKEFVSELWELLVMFWLLWFVMCRV